MRVVCKHCGRLVAEQSAIKMNMVEFHQWKAFKGDDPTGLCPRPSSNEYHEYTQICESCFKRGEKTHEPKTAQEIEQDAWEYRNSDKYNPSITWLAGMKVYDNAIERVYGRVTKIIPSGGLFGHDVEREVDADPPEEIQDYLDDQAIDASWEFIVRALMHEVEEGQVGRTKAQKDYTKQYIAKWTKYQERGKPRSLLELLYIESLEKEERDGEMQSV